MKKKINIIYICIAEKGPSGGGKIIYKHSELINNLNKDFTSQVLHIKKNKYKKWSTSINKFLNISNQKYFGWKFSDVTANQSYKSKWFKNNITIKSNFNFNKDRDFVIIPEIFAHFANDFLIKDRIPYAIFAQNGYCLKPTNNFNALDRAYKKAKFILSYSKDITNCVNLAFPFCKHKILNIKYSINKKDFNLSLKKNKLITYMPRKLPDHSEHLIFFLRRHLPKSWKIKALHNLKQSKVYNYLCKSKIFLAFSNLEGLPLPPVEAAIAGNKVIGYTGEGGKEYWNKPIFTEISNGDFSKFHSEIISFIKSGNKNKKFKIERERIIKNFSPELEMRKIKLMLKKINSFY